jgi:transcriptional regulator with XRE-family HTH domain
VIKNNRQYRATLKQIGKFKNAISYHGTNVSETDSAYRGMKSMLETLERQVREYESLLEGDPNSIVVNGLHDLPRALIKARICRGLSQRQLAEKLGLKSQQIQRWEFEDYENISFSRLEDVSEALGLSRKITIRDTRPQNSFSSFRPIDFRRSPSGVLNVRPEVGAKWEVTVAKGSLRSGANDEAPVANVALIRTNSGVSISVSGYGSGFDGRWSLDEPSPRTEDHWQIREYQERKHG